MEIENTQTENENELSKEALLAIENFKNEILNKKTVSLNDVLGLEEFIGTSIITSKVESNMISSLPTESGVPEILNALKEYTIREDDIDNINIDTYMRLLYISIDALSNISTLLNSVKNIPSDKLELYRDTKILLAYEDNTLIDYSNENIHKLLTSNYDICVKLGFTEKSLWDQYRTKVSFDEVAIYKLLSLLKNKDINPMSIEFSNLTEITYNDVMDIITDTSMVTEINKTIKYLYNEINYYKLGKVDYDIRDYDTLKKSIKRFEYYTTILKDKPSLIVLSLFINN